MEAVLVLVHGEVDQFARTLDEHRVPVLIVQQAAQGEVDRGVRRGQSSVSLEKKNKSTIILSLKKKKLPFHQSPSFIIISISFHAFYPNTSVDLPEVEQNILSTLP